MNPSLLPALWITAEQVMRLPNKVLEQLLHFLIRWEAYEDAIACLDANGPSILVSIYDLRAEALAGAGRPFEAIATMQERLGMRDSTTARIKLAEIYLNGGDAPAAQTLLEQVGSEGSVAIWNILGDAHLAQGRPDAAEAAYLQGQKWSAENRAGLAGLAEVQRQRGQPVAAAAYAVRAFSVLEGQPGPSIPLLRRLRDFFRVTGDANRLADAEAQLQTRLENELGQMTELLAAELGSTGAAERKRRAPAPGASAPEAAAFRQESAKDAHASAGADAGTAPPDLSSIPVSEQERAGLLAGMARYFGFNSFLQGQAEIMACVRRGENVLAILPTGGGKSLCYQLPALLDAEANQNSAGRGITLVISPLIALMKDQIDNLPAEVRSHAVAINSSLDGPELRRALATLHSGRCSMVYAAPERLRQPPFLHALRDAGIARLVIDEAHCVSIWGHDFRPDYLIIARVAHDLGDPPILAVTATAPPRVRQDIQLRLFGRTHASPEVQGIARAGRGESRAPHPFGASAPPRLIATDTYRPNLRLSAIYVRDDDEKLGRLMELCRQLPGSGIVYGRTRRRCEELAQIFQRQGISAGYYHAGLEPGARAAVQEGFMRGEPRMIVATVAFGMGIDKPDIRYIIHFGLPDSVEGYYQEAGRAGRDGELSHCILIYSNSDRATLWRHAREGAIEIEFLRRVYATVSRRLKRRNPGIVPLVELMAEVGGEDTNVRVALSILEQAGLLRRDYDTPETGMLRWHGLAEADPLLERVMAAAGVQRGQGATRDLLGLAAACGLAPADLDAHLLRWHGASQIDYQPFSRDLLLEMPSPPIDAATRIESLLGQYAAIQEQRVTEIWDYARTQRCRHGHLANYLGGRPRRQCDACDNCLDDIGIHAGATEAMPDNAAQLRTILAALAERSAGRRNLALLLRGDPGFHGQRGATYGGLSFRSETGIGKLVDALIDAGYVEEHVLSHGGVALGITPAGRQALDGKARLEGLMPERAATPRKWAEVGKKDRRHNSVRQGDFDPTDPGTADLYERLRAWRAGEARQAGKPAFWIFQERVLQAIAAAKPHSVQDLARVYGLGRHKCEAYGQAILQIVRQVEKSQK